MSPSNHRRFYWLDMFLQRGKFIWKLIIAVNAWQCRAYKIPIRLEKLKKKKKYFHWCCHILFIFPPFLMRKWKSRTFQWHARRCILLFLFLDNFIFHADCGCATTVFITAIDWLFFFCFSFRFSTSSLHSIPIN